MAQKKIVRGVQLGDCIFCNSITYMVVSGTSLMKENIVAHDSTPCCLKCSAGAEEV